MRRRRRRLAVLLFVAVWATAATMARAQDATRRPLPTYVALPPGISVVPSGGRDAVVEFGRDAFDYQPAPGQSIKHVSADGHNWILVAKAQPASPKLDQAGINAGVRSLLVAQGWEILAERPWLIAHREKGGVSSWIKLEGTSDYLTIHVLEESKRTRTVTLAAPASAAEPLTNDAEPPYLGRFPGSVKQASKLLAQDLMEVRAPGDKEGTWVGRPLWHGEYRSPIDFSPLEFNAAYADALTAAGWRIVQNSGGGSMGDATLSAHFANATRDLWLKTHATNAAYDLWIADAGAAAESRALKEALDRDGHVALYGIYFDSDSTVIKPESEATLAQVVRLLTANPALAITLEGHTDNTSTRPHNQTLSEGRAASVVRYLVAHGVAAARLTSAGFADTRPVADNGSPQGRAKNRRVELAKK